MERPVIGSAARTDDRLTISDVLACGRHANDSGQGELACVRILTIMIHGNEFTGSIITAATDSRAHALGGVNAVIGTEVG